MYGKDSLALEEVQNTLMSKELKRKLELQEEGVGDGLLIRATHLRKDCPVLRNYNSKKVGNADVVLDGEDTDGYVSASVLTISKNGSKGVWIIDSGYSFDIYPNRSQFLSYATIKIGTVKLGDSRTCPILGIGTVMLNLDGGNVTKLRHVRHVPDIKRNLMSFAMMDQDGCSVKVENGMLKVIKGSTTVMTRVTRNGIYILNGSSAKNHVNATILDKNRSTMIWHKRLGHISHGCLKYLRKKGVFGKEQITDMDLFEQCVLRKSTKIKFGIGKCTSSNKLDYLHLDVWGLPRTLSRGGPRYFLTIIDVYTRYVWIHILKNKYDAFNKFKELRGMLETQT
uniref:Retrovirus-related Pol polyprotein from transposon TNT 1-94 n=1 Tax=Cannabis sativa TaxID=3483 RepID=A0A803NL66_CANSA